MADRQKTRVYRWERMWADWNVKSLNAPQIRKYTDWVCHLYGLEPLALLLAKNDRGWSWYRDETRTIRLLKTHQNTAVCLHELAHAVIAEYFPAAEDHGPEWLGVYLWLLREANLAPDSALHASLKEQGLRWKPLHKSSPKYLRSVQE